MSRSEMHKKKNLIPIYILAIIVVIVVGVIITIKIKNKDKPKQVDEFVSEYSNGIKENTSSKLHEDKLFEGIQISDINLLQRTSNTTSLVGTIKNISDSVQGGYTLNIRILDKNGNELLSIPVNVPSLEPGATTPLISTTSYDLINAYDIVLEK